MRKYGQLTDAEIFEGIDRTEKMITAGRNYLAFLATGQGLPRDLSAREELAGSHTKLIAGLEAILEELNSELRARKE